MARRDSLLLDILFSYPWWLNVILAGVAYGVLKFWLPTIEFESAPWNALAHITAPRIAGMVAGLFLFIAFLTAIQSFRKRLILDTRTDMDSIRSLTWKEFEYLAGEAFRRRGYVVEENIGGGADGGVDVTLFKGGEKTVVQCKNWNVFKVGVPVVRELYGVMAATGAQRGIIITSGIFTQDAEDFARDKPVELMNGSKLLQFIGRVQKVPAKTAAALLPPGCPLCGREMVRRIARKGPNAGEQFWGCPKYPECKGTRPQ